MGILFDQDIITRNYENEIFEEGKAEGMEQGMYSATTGAILIQLKINNFKFTNLLVKITKLWYN